MAQQQLRKIVFKPGINKQDSDLGSEGGWKDSDWSGFVTVNQKK